MEPNIFINVVPIKQFFFQFRSGKSTITHVIVDDSRSLNFYKPVNWNKLEDNLEFQLGALSVFLFIYYILKKSFEL